MTNEMLDRYSYVMWRKSREDAGKSQAYMAEALGVSKSTVQHWEIGYSNPGKDYGFKWFEVLGLHPLAYYIQAIYDFNSYDIESMDEKEINSKLVNIISSLPLSEKAKLLYCFSSGQGANPIAKINLMYANDLAPLRDRINVARSICSNYEISEHLDQIPHDCPIRPDMDLLHTAIDAGKEAVIQGKSTYGTIIGELEVNV